MSEDRTSSDEAPESVGQTPDPRLGRANRRVAASTVTLVASNTIVAALGALTLHVISSHLGATTYGVFVSVLAFTTAAQLIGDLGINAFSGREIARRMDEASSILGQNLGLRLAMSAVMIPAVIGVGLAYPHSETVRLEGIAIASLTIPCEAIRSVSLSYYVATIQNYKTAVVVLISQVVYVTGAVIAIYAGFGIIGCFVAFDISMIATAASAVFLVRRNIHYRPQFVPSAWRTVIKQSFGVGAIQIVNVLYLRMNTLLLTALSSYHTVGQYGVAAAIVTYLVAIPAAFMQSMLPLVVGATERTLTPLVNRAGTIMGITGALVVTGTTCLARDGVLVLAGPKFGGSVIILQILSVSVLFTCLTLVLTYSSFARDQHRRLLFISGSGLACNVLLDLLLIPHLGARGAAISTIVVECVLLVGAYGIFRAQVGNHFTAWSQLGRILLAGAGTYAVCRFSLGRLLPPGLGQLAVGLVLIPAVLGVMLWVLRCMPEELSPPRLLRAARQLGTRVRPG